MNLTGTLLILMAAAPSAWAAVAAPEIDGNSFTAGVALLAGAVLVLRSRRK